MVLTAVITIAGGVIVYTFGHFLTALCVEPIHKLRSLIGEIAYSLVFYAPIYGNPGIPKKEIIDEAGVELRHQASQIEAIAHCIPLYRFWALMHLVPKRTNIELVSAELIGLSNSLHDRSDFMGQQNIVRAITIDQILGIHELPAYEQMRESKKRKRASDTPGAQEQNKV